MSSRSVPGVSAGLCLFVLGHFPWTFCLLVLKVRGLSFFLVLSSSALDLLLWKCVMACTAKLAGTPYPPSWNCADSLDAFEWVTKVLQHAETQRPPVIWKFVGHSQVPAVMTDTYKHTHSQGASEVTSRLPVQLHLVPPGTRSKVSMVWGFLAARWQWPMEMFHRAVTDVICHLWS